MIQSIDHAALLPLYAAGGAALLVLIADLVTGRRGPVIGTAAVGAAVTAVAAIAGSGRPATFCVGTACSWVPSPRGSGSGEDGNVARPRFRFRVSDNRVVHIDSC